jgi:hypothetical protein
MKNYPEIIKRHELFWTMQTVKRPLLINALGDWVDGPRLIASVPALPKGCLKPDDIRPGDFLPELTKICEEGEAVADDKIAMTEPLSPLPWMEAYFGCAVNHADRHMWSKSSIKGVPDIEAAIKKGVNREWQDKYFEFFHALLDYSPRWAVSQPILRGISDVAAAMVGTQEMLFAMFDEPDLMCRFFDYICQNMMNFFEEHLKHIRPFYGGYTVGQYHLWTPEHCIRIQDDSMAVVSPALFKEFFLPRIARLAGITDYTVIHLHLTSAHVLDQILSLAEIKAVEYDIDEGSAKAAMYVDNMKKIQAAGKPLIIKARFSGEDLDTLTKRLDFRGLCLIPVVRNKAEAQEILNYFGV